MYRLVCTHNKIVVVVLQPYVDFVPVLSVEQEER